MGNLGAWNLKRIRLINYFHHEEYMSKCYFHLIIKNCKQINLIPQAFIEAMKTTAKEKVTMGANNVINGPTLQTVRLDQGPKGSPNWKHDV